MTKLMLMAVVLLAWGRAGFGVVGESLDLLVTEGKGEMVLSKEERGKAVGEVMDGIFARQMDAELEGRLNEAAENFEAGWDTGLGKVMTAWEFRKDAAVKAGDVKASKWAEKFPGGVAADAARVKREMVIVRGGGGWKSTGLYAAPGEVVRVTAPEGAVREAWSVRIGAHTDRLWKLEKWERFPEISRTVLIKGATTEAASPFGGLIYLIARPGQGSEKVVIEGAVEAPRFVLGETKMEEWMKVREAAGPWTELEGKRAVLTVPTKVVRKLEDPGKVMEFWDRVLDADAELAGIEKERTKKERMAADVQISAGYMHSGYPIMTHLDAAARMVDVGGLEKNGDWGMFHELGHNHQAGDWTFEGTGEVTCNLFTLYAMEKVSPGAPLRKGLSEAEMLTTMRKHVAGGAEFAKWKSDPFLALCMYVQMKDAFGWEVYKKVFAEYRGLKREERPRNDQEKRDQWMERMSRASGRNLGPFFQVWGVPVSEEAKGRVKELPGWMPAGWK